MKIQFCQLKAGSGVDIWTKNLSRSIKALGVDTSVSYYSPYYQICPYLLKFIDKKSSSADIVHCNSWNGFAFKEKGKPLIITEHHIVHDPALKPYYTFQQKLFYELIFHYEHLSLQYAAKIVSVSYYTKKMLEHVFGYNDSIVIHNGIDSCLFRPLHVEKKNFLLEHDLPKDSIILFYAGNFSYRKGVDLFPKILKRLGNRFILVITAGIRSKNIFTLDNIISIGKINENELINMYNICDIFLFPSRLEGFGLSVAEAMSCGKPIIATNGSALPELVIHEKGGFLCEMNNIDEFVSYIKYLSEDENLMRLQGQFNRQRIEKYFTIEKMAQSYLKVYKDLL